MQCSSFIVDGSPFSPFTVLQQPKKQLVGSSAAGS
jgi:hypothetical protein